MGFVNTKIKIVNIPQSNEMPENNKNLNMRWSNDSTQSNFSNKQSKYCSLSQSKEFMVFPANIRLSEETLKMSGRGLLSSSSEDVFKHLQDVLIKMNIFFTELVKKCQLG